MVLGTWHSSSPSTLGLHGMDTFGSLLHSNVEQKVSSKIAVVKFYPESDILHQKVERSH